MNSPKHYLKPLFWLWLLWGTCSLLAQTDNDKGVLSLQTYGVKDGLEVGDIHSLVYDNNGWLWISGLESDLGASTFLKNVPKLQWFDGYNFHTVPLPISEELSPISFLLKKRADGLFYLWFSSNGFDEIYLFDPSTFKVQSVPIPTLDGHVDISNIFVQDTSTFISLDAFGKSSLFRLNDDLSFDKLFDLMSERGESHLHQVIPFKDHFLISEARMGITAYGLKGQILKEFDYEDFGLEKVANPEVLALVGSFLFEGKYQFVLKNGYGTYQYNDHEMTWSESNFKPARSAKKTLINTGLYQKLYAINDNHGNIAWFNVAEGQLIIKRAYVDEAHDQPDVRVNRANAINAASRDLKKELFLTEPGRLAHVVFKNFGVSTFLEDHSLRCIIPYGPNRYLVATEASGFYLIDIAENTEEPFPIFLDGQPFSASEIRGVFMDQRGIWTNYNEGVLFINPDTREVERFRHYPVSAMVDDGNRIVYGAANFPLMEFDKSRKVNRPLTKNDSLNVMDLTKFNDSFYATTTSGLFKFKQGEEVYVDIPISSDKLMMLSVLKRHGLLFTTVDGRVYQIKEENSRPELFFTDPAGSPIASVFEDQEKNLWFATFSGLVKFNPQTGETERFVEDDGLSNNEFNRFSFLQLENGGVFLGAIKGLNYFFPQDLEKVEKGGEVVLTGLTYFDSKVKSNTTIIAPAELTELGSVSLPAENKFLRIQVAPVGLTQPTKVNMEFKLNNGEWLPIKQPGEIQFNNLEAGQYLLKVRMVDSEGASFGKELSLHIHAREFFYKTLWFGFLCLLVVIVVSYYFIRQANKARALGQHYSRALLRVQEEERMRISRDLHDSVGQQLILLKNQANASRDPQMVKNVSATLEEVRSITRNLHPVVLSRLGLTAALEELIRKLDENTEVFFAIELENIDGIFDAEEELNLYRIIQEALNNIVKHANAVSAKLTIARKKNKVLINIQDNGKGFSVENEQQSGGSLGLKTLHERIAMLKGKINIESDAHGTRIELEIPLQ
ncbi:sensor histidine kinase [Roseivirga thermotolerans]|uniref:sensor histidine kinase n=1 Tax=Roseivirga thermotolerans TaxID=1758176 RepID=UPI001675AE99|nr:sensor histidine kinase [Roseivirga thermotolerans]